MATITKVSRRDFLKVTGVAGTGLVLGFHLPLAGCGHEELSASVDGFMPNAWLRIDPDGEVTLWVHRPDMGQGTRTSLPMILADELEVEWPKFQRQQADAAPMEVYSSQTAGGSTSIRTSWARLRQAGATGRAMLISAAAAEWSVEPASCRAYASTIIHDPSGRRLSYGELAEKAAALPVPEDPPLKDPKDFRIIGKPLPRLDHPARVRGEAVFGIDVRVPGMLYACVARCPVFGGSVTTYDGAAAKAVEGVRDVVEIETGVAVVADSTWTAMKGREALKPQFDPGPAAELSSASIARLFDERQKDPGIATREDGDPDAALASAARTFEAVYEVPYLSHSPLEPMNCTADVREDHCEIWAPTQAPQWGQQAAAEITGLPLERIALHVTLSGGAFGRRLIQDFVREAVQISKAVAAPVKLIWTREDDTHHGWYRPASRHLMSAGLDALGRVVAWKHRVVAPSIAATVSGADERAAAYEATDGAANLPYAIPNIRVDYCMANTAVPVCWLRSVYNTQTPFANECFLDELIHAIGKDPYEFRMELLQDHPRHKGVLELAATNAGWGEPLPEGRYRGIAVHYSFYTYVSQVAEISVNDDGTVKVHRVVCAVDCGRVVNPDGVTAQMEGGIVMGLTAALKGAITIEDGRVVQSNFHDYPLLVISEMPEIEVHLVTSTENPTGVGEPGLPPIAPALANAIFAATGKRIRRLPIRPEDLRKT
jgi:isoquinoline 1-oxidoreductase beta subunit